VIADGAVGWAAVALSDAGMAARLNTLHRLDIIHVLSYGQRKLNQPEVIV
jgi:hypothetical protein